MKSYVTYFIKKGFTDIVQHMLGEYPVCDE